MRLAKLTVTGAMLCGLLGCTDRNEGVPGAEAMFGPSDGQITGNPPKVPPPSVATTPRTKPAVPPPPTSAVAPAGGIGGSVVDPSLAPPRSDRAPAPIQGGTLLITRAGRAVVSDPDRDRLLIVDLAGSQILATLALDESSEPGRAVEDEAGQVHVVLRRAGQLATVDMKQNQVTQRVDVCSMPQSVAFEPSTRLLHVACADGQLVSLPSGGGEVTRRVRVDSDLRDVMVRDGRLLVTRFKAAELLELDGEGGVVSRRRPAQVTGPLIEPSVGAVSLEAKRFDAAVAWRTTVAPDGRLVMVHQRAQVDPIALHGEGGAATGEPVGGRAAAGTAGAFAQGFTGGVGGGVASIVPLPGPGPGPGGNGGSPYGGGQGCDSIVQSGVTYLGEDGETSGPLLPGAVLPVDAAVSPNGRWIAIATPGAFQSRTGFNQPFSVVVMPMGVVPRPDDFVNDGSVMSDPQTSAEPFGGGKCLLPTRDMPGQLLQSGQVVAVAFDAQGRLVVQTRDPNELRVTTLDPNVCMGCESYDTVVPLGGVPRRDVGHDTFHVNAGGGLSCASCHPGGGDDGRTWNFVGIGPRRTQLFNMGIKDTLPLHWDGEFSNMNELLLDVFVQRMGGQNLQLAEAEGLQDYIDTLRPNTRIRAADDAAALRGKALFETAEVGCTECHSGPKLTNNKTVDVGTGGLFQVPSLIGVAYHEPFMHTGCAATLRDRFSADCGGSKHGNTQSLSAQQIDDLIAYLESL